MSGDPHDSSVERVYSEEDLAQAKKEAAKEALAEQAAKQAEEEREKQFVDMQGDVARNSHEHAISDQRMEKMERALWGDAQDADKPGALAKIKDHETRIVANAEGGQAVVEGYNKIKSKQIDGRQWGKILAGAGAAGGSGYGIVEAVIYALNRLG